jgi:hypothetical protein
LWRRLLETTRHRLDHTCRCDHTIVHRSALLLLVVNHSRERWKPHTGLHKVCLESAHPIERRAFDNREGRPAKRGLPSSAHQATRGGTVSRELFELSLPRNPSASVGLLAADERKLAQQRTMNTGVAICQVLWAIGTAQGVEFQR